MSRRAYARAYYHANRDRRRFQSRMYAAMIRNSHRSPVGWAMRLIGQVLTELK